MSQQEKAAVQALKQALALEKDGHAFYLRAAERTVDRKGQEMFQSLAEDEVVHVHVIQRQMDALSEGQGWSLPEDMGEVNVDLETPLFPQGKVNLERAVRPDASDLDALLFALGIENDSFDMYRKQAQAATNADARQLYEYLANAERTHFNLLMLNYESLNEGGSSGD